MKPYRCLQPTCSKNLRFAARAALKRHEKVVHGMHGYEPVVCPNCNKDISRRDNLKPHLERCPGVQISTTIEKKSARKRQVQSRNTPIEERKRRRLNAPIAAEEDCEDAIGDVELQLKEVEQQTTVNNLVREIQGLAQELGMVKKTVMLHNDILVDRYDEDGHFEGCGNWGGPGDLAGGGG